MVGWRNRRSWDVYKRQHLCWTFVLKQTCSNTPNFLKYLLLSTSNYAVKVENIKFANYMCLSLYNTWRAIMRVITPHCATFFYGVGNITQKHTCRKIFIINCLQNLYKNLMNIIIKCVESDFEKSEPTNIIQPTILWIILFIK